MLNKFRNYAVAALFATMLIAAQSFAALTGVTVSGSLSDPSGNTWSNALVTFTFQAGPGGVTPGTNQSTATEVVTTNASGAFSGVLLGDTSILGGGSRWQFSVVGSNGQTFGGVMNVTAATTSLSTVMSAFSPLIVGTGRANVIQAGATFTPSIAQSGAVILLGALTGSVITLPVPVLGTSYTFVVTVSNTSNYNEIETDSSATFLLGAVDHTATGIAPLAFWANGTSTQAIKMDGAHLGGLIGTKLVVNAISTTQWQIAGTNLGTATMTTAFTATP
jgi:hypothetical protein